MPTTDQEHAPARVQETLQTSPEISQSDDTAQTYVIDTCHHVAVRIGGREVQSGCASRDRRGSRERNFRIRAESTDTITIAAPSSGAW